MKRVLTASEVAHMREAWGDLPPAPSEEVGYDSPELEAAVCRIIAAYEAVDASEAEVEALAIQEGWNPTEYRRCGACGNYTEETCPDCEDFRNEMVYVCENTACRDDHARKVNCTPL